MTIRLSGRARSDLEEIRAHTVETWGRDQWLVYYRQLVTAFEQITGDPDRGRDRRLFVPGMRSVNCQRHVIFYKRKRSVDTLLSASCCRNDRLCPWGIDSFPQISHCFDATGDQRE
ncbi:type II toxin-antitoxin system RelE/ParE family toxin [Thioclava pacifica]|uniref:Plasmid stabilization protein ParE n=1 Tax=Thioclava pacifica DSM 10166 TaxID=1353537 RepID=A0A074JHB6_9RHOB|nr:type II toxin-antitoxin system RelE/ParE family toxin [Thioclava pacifica]KEO55295.1 hypothetical protein TP2_16000 [Thioclava pacifica DSM 10166]